MAKAKRRISKEMNELIKGLNYLSGLIDFGPFTCIGCDYGHDRGLQKCNEHGCDIIYEGIKTAQFYSEAYKVLEKQKTCDTCIYNGPDEIKGTPCEICVDGEE